MDRDHRSRPAISVGEPLPHPSLYKKVTQPTSLSPSLVLDPKNRKALSVPGASASLMSIEEEEEDFSQSWYLASQNRRKPILLSSSKNEKYRRKKSTVEIAPSSVEKDEDNEKEKSRDSKNTDDDQDEELKRHQKHSPGRVSLINSDDKINILPSTLLKTMSDSKVDEEEEKFVTPPPESRRKRSFVRLSIRKQNSMKADIPVIYTTTPRERKSIDVSTGPSDVSILDVEKKKQRGSYSEEQPGPPATILTSEELRATETQKKSGWKSVLISSDLPYSPDDDSDSQTNKVMKPSRRPMGVKRVASDTSFVSGYSLLSASTMASGNRSLASAARSLASALFPLEASPQHSKVMRRFYDSAPPPPDSTSTRLRFSMVGGPSPMLSRRMSVGRRSHATVAAATAALAEAAAKAASAAAAEAASQLRTRSGGSSQSPHSDDTEYQEPRNISKKQSPLLKLLEGDSDDPLYASSPMAMQEFPGEMPPLATVFRAMAMGREYRVRYRGTWGPYSNPEGLGNMTRPFKVEYEGEFQDGTCHGMGALHYPNASVIRGVWDHGHLRKPAYSSPDGLEYDPQGPYCKMPDRRYYTEIQNGLRPAGRSQLTNQHPPRPVPPGCYDAGDGIFDPRRNCIYDPESLNVVRVPTNDEMDWIKKNCRKGWDENVGYRPDLFENWEEKEPSEKVEEEQVGPEEEEEEEWGEEAEEVVEEEERPLEEEAEEVESEPSEVSLPLLMKGVYPPGAVQDFTLDAAPPVDIMPSLFPETEGEPPQTLKDKLMVPVDTELSPENLRMRKRYMSMIEAERALVGEEPKPEEEEKAEEKGKEKEKGKAQSPPSTPRLSLDETTDLYKGPWSHVARRLIPALRQRIDEDRHKAAIKWQEDLLQLLTERATLHGFEMSTSGYLGMSRPVSERLPSTARVIFPPGLEERARQRRAEREERERQDEEKRVAEMLAKEASGPHDSGSTRGLSTRGSSSSSERGEMPDASRRRSSVLPSRAMSAPKGGRDSTVDEGRASYKKKSLQFKEDDEGLDI